MQSQKKKFAEGTPPITQTLTMSKTPTITTKSLKTLKAMMLTMTMSNKLNLMAKINNPQIFDNGCANSMMNTTAKMKGLRIIRLEVTTLAILDKSSSIDTSWFKSSDGVTSQLFGLQRISNMGHMWRSKSWNLPHITLTLHMTRLKFYKKLQNWRIPLNGSNQSANIKIKSLSKSPETILMSSTF